MACRTPAERAARSGPGSPTASLSGAGAVGSSAVVSTTGDAGSLRGGSLGDRVTKQRHRKERDGGQQDREEEDQPDPTLPFTQLTHPRHAARKGPMPFGQHLLPSLSGTCPT